MNKVKTRIGTYFISFLCGLGGNGGKCLIGGLARLAAVRETRRAIAPAKDEAAPGREPLHYVAGYPVKLALRRMGEEQSVGVVEKSPADILVVNREEVDVLVRVEGEHGPRRLHAPRIHAVVRQGICAAAARTHGQGYFASSDEAEPSAHQDARILEEPPGTAKSIVSPVKSSGSPRSMPSISLLVQRLPGAGSGGRMSTLVKDALSSGRSAHSSGRFGDAAKEGLVERSERRTASAERLQSVSCMRVR